ncbi:MAG: F0F1 ATP synthase subunit gamma, partial [Acidimicrobiia bacterium]
MAGGQERLLRRRIKSIQSTQKITRAMELIAASRIVKAQAAVVAAQPYSEAITQVVRDLAVGGGGGDSPLLNPRDEIRRVGFIVVAADRGLSGAYNSSVIRVAERALLAEQAQGRDYSLVVVGRKVESYFRYRGYRIDAVFTGFTEQPTYEDARQVGAAATSTVLAGDTDLVEIVYTHFVSSGTQEVVRQTLMPLAPEGDADAPTRDPETVPASYEFEPSPEGILDLLLPRYVDSRVYSALLNAAASEHAARQRAMSAATENADELMTSLSRVMNRARQDSITTEIMEIVSGAEALRSGTSETDYLSDTIEGRDADLFAVH